MLQIQHICKEYRTGNLVQKALDDVSLNLRDNEFVAILGPSGSGKTTLLNIIGGFDPDWMVGSLCNRNGLRHHLALHLRLQQKIKKCNSR